MLKMDMTHGHDTRFFSNVLFQYSAIVPGVLSVIQSETVATLLSKHFECLHEIRDKSCILQSHKPKLYLRYQIKYMKKRTFLESFIVRPRPVFKISLFLFRSSPKLH
jgi:hypothetical protein